MQSLGLGENAHGGKLLELQDWSSSVLVQLQAPEPSRCTAPSLALPPSLSISFNKERDSAYSEAALVLPPMPSSLPETQLGLA